MHARTCQGPGDFQRLSERHIARLPQLASGIFHHIPALLGQCQKDDQRKPAGGKTCRPSTRRIPFSAQIAASELVASAAVFLAWTARRALANLRKPGPEKLCKCSEEDNPQSTGMTNLFIDIITIRDRT